MGPKSGGLFHSCSTLGETREVSLRQLHETQQCGDIFWEQQALSADSGSPVLARSAIVSANSIAKAYLSCGTALPLVPCAVSPTPQRQIASGGPFLRDHTRDSACHNPYIILPVNCVGALHDSSCSCPAPRDTLDGESLLAIQVIHFIRKEVGRKECDSSCGTTPAGISEALYRAAWTRPHELTQIEGALAHGQRSFSGGSHAMLYGGS